MRISRVYDASSTLISGGGHQYSFFSCGEYDRMGTLAIDYDLSLVKLCLAHNMEMSLQRLPLLIEATATVDDEPGAAGLRS